MSIIKNHKESITAALGAAAAAAAPAMLFVGVGTAHAQGTIWNTADYLGTTVFVASDGQTYGQCTYNAFPMVGPGIPPGPRNFILEPNGPPAQLWFPGVKLNTTWQVTVHCDNGPDITTDTVY
ncbi:hypothetical protein [Mycobacterium sp. 852002-51057_SCH5723018]|uniref:hypothetical protein n=1 Tax=Mycobacterium sp. 852002-51057_SCH5723018 TaxID=1834094 RepID=UPI0009ECFBB2|nr:hypothetical protein [Mycobacterium sp. 852002-51057_SCH5723018]